MVALVAFASPETLLALMIRLNAAGLVAAIVARKRGGRGHTLAGLAIALDAIALGLLLLLFAACYELRGFMAHNQC